MDNQSDLLQSRPKDFKLPLNIFFTTISISSVIIGIVIYSFHLGDKMSTKFSPLVDASMEIKLETTIAHLWFEEIISGDRQEKIEDVLRHIDNAIWYGVAMLEGGQNAEGIFVPLADPILRASIAEVVAQIKIFKEITEERYLKIKESGVGSPIDQKYDAVFLAFQEQADVVETHLQRTIADDQKKYHKLHKSLLAALILLTLFLLFIFYRYEKQRALDIALIIESHDKVKVLSGFLPICASCKKIRDDQGYWKEIESYIKEHSEAEFSHGICIECAKELYPDFVDENGEFIKDK